jgi:hypothetical protein
VSDILTVPATSLSRAQNAGQATQFIDGILAHQTR